MEHRERLQNAIDNMEKTEHCLDIFDRALAEKDREIAKWRRIRTPTHGTCCTCQGCGLDHDSCRCDLDDVCDDLDQLKKAYQQLMEKAVRFARSIYDPNVIDNDPIYVEAQAYLKERDLEADPFGDVMKQFYKEREGT